MYVVIDIDEAIYNYIKQLGSIPTRDTQYLANAIFDGIPLPKEHRNNLDDNGKLERIDDECGNQKKIREKYIAVKQSDFEDNGDTFKAIKDGFGLPPLGYKYVKIKG